MSDILFWTVHRWSSWFDVRPVAKETDKTFQGFNRRMARSECYGRFQTEAEAIKEKEALTSARREFLKPVKELEGRIYSLSREVDRKISDFLKTRNPQGTNEP